MSSASPHQLTTHRTPAEWALDGGLSGGLLAALAMVYILNAGHPHDPTADAPKAVVKTEQVEEIVDSAPPLRMAVTSVEYDDLGETLKRLGQGFDQFQVLKLDELLDPAKYREFDILFFTCGTVPDGWCESETGESNRPGTVSVTVKHEIRDKMRDNLRAFVDRGGTLYASDLRFPMIHNAFQEFAPTAYTGDGARQTVNADVDGSLSTLVGQQLSLEFDQPGWRPAAFNEDKVDVLMRGEYKNMSDERVAAPLLVRFQHGEGTVIFTSFHNEKQNSEAAQKLLKALVFATVLARTQTKTNKTLVQGGFKPVGNSMIGAAAAAQAVTQSYQATKPVTLKFSVGFEPRGGILKLTVVTPSGVKHEDKGNTSFDLEVPCDRAGEWKYTIEAVKSPPGDFPFALTIGEK